MIAVINRDGQLSIRIGGATLIWMTPGWAYKLYWGKGARVRYRHELDRIDRARSCPIWGAVLLPFDRHQIPGLIKTVRGKQVEPGGPRDAALRRFVEQRLTAASRLGEPLPASRLVELAALATALDDPASQASIARIERKLSALTLRSGPVHGDLHRGNIIEVDGRHFVIDCNRFNPSSAPLLDRIHFLMTERKLHSRKKWLELLFESEDLIVSAMRADRINPARLQDVALAYGANRIALEAFDAKLAKRPVHKYRAMLARLENSFGDRGDLPEYGHGECAA